MQLAIFANRFNVCTALADLQFKILLKIDIHVRFIKMHVLSNRFFKKNTIDSCKFMQLAIFWQMYLCARV